MEGTLRKLPTEGGKQRNYTQKKTNYIFYYFSLIFHFIVHAHTVFFTICYFPTSLHTLVFFYLIFSDLIMFYLYTYINNYNRLLPNSLFAKALPKNLKITFILPRFLSLSLFPSRLHQRCVSQQLLNK